MHLYNLISSKDETQEAIATSKETKRKYISQKTPSSTCYKPRQGLVICEKHWSAV